MKNAKSESRNSKQISNPKSEPRPELVSDFPFRASDLFRISSFEFRSLLSLPLLFPDQLQVPLGDGAVGEEHRISDQIKRFLKMLRGLERIALFQG